VEYSEAATQELESERGRQLAQKLKKLSEIHTEGTLLLLRSYVEFSNLGILSGDFQNLTADQIVGLENMRDNYRACLERRFLLDYDRQEVWKGIYLASMLLAEYAKKDVQRNREAFIEAVSHVEAVDTVPINHVRGYVITLIEAGAIKEANRWAESWVDRTGRKSFEAFWHLMIVAQRQQDWMRLEALGREGRELFPESEELANFHKHALEKIREVVDFEKSESQDNDSQE
jgi:hypothetical protein